VHETKTRVEYKISVKSTFASSLFANQVVIKIPTPTNAARAVISVPIGKAKYNSGENALVWKYVFRWRFACL
jgi:AP-2 complex subunit mu-1